MKDIIIKKDISNKERKKKGDEIAGMMVKQLKMEGIKVNTESKLFQKYLGLILNGLMTVEEAVALINEKYVIRQASTNRKVDRVNSYIP